MMTRIIFDVEGQTVPEMQGKVNTIIGRLFPDNGTVTPSMDMEVVPTGATRAGYPDGWKATVTVVEEWTP